MTNDNATDLQAAKALYEFCREDGREWENLTAVEQSIILFNYQNVRLAFANVFIPQRRGEI